MAMMMVLMHNIVWAEHNMFTYTNESDSLFSGDPTKASRNGSELSKSPLGRSYFFSLFSMLVRCLVQSGRDTTAAYPFGCKETTRSSYSGTVKGDSDVPVVGGGWAGCGRGVDVAVAVGEGLLVRID